MQMYRNQFYNGFNFYLLYRVYPIYQQILTQYKAMSRNNVFKLSGNMALGSNDNYSNPNDFENIKSSLKLLKSKQQNQKRPDLPLEPANVYGGSYSSNIPTRQPPTNKNIPNYQYQNSYNYPQTNSRNSQQPTSQSYKDVYPVENNYPNNQYKYKKSQPEYEPQKYQDRNQYQKPQRQQQEQQQPSRHQQQQQPTRQQQQPPQRQQQQPPQRQQQAPQRQQPQRHQQQQYNYNRSNDNGYEDKTIKEVNRQNRVEIREYDPSEYVECSQGCGRTFNPDSISKHENICKKVFQKKRKVFNTQNQRVESNEQKKLMKRGEVIDKKLEEKKAKEKVPKWKAESLQLRSGIKQARDDDYEPTKQQKKILEQAKNDNFVKCRFCGRSFNEQAAKRHMPFCQTQMKKNQMKKK